MKTKTLAKLITLSTLTAGLAACGGSSDPRPSGELRIIHAAADAPDVRVRLENDGIDAAPSVAISRLAFAESSAFLKVGPSRYNAAVDAYLPENAFLEDVIDATLLVEQNRQFTIIAAGLLSEGNFGSILIETERAAVPRGFARLQLVHAAALAPAVDVYVASTDPVTPPEIIDPPEDEEDGELMVFSLDADDDTFSCTDGDPVVSAVSFRDFTERLEVAAGNYQICVTLAGTDTRVFESDIVTLRSGNDLLVAAIDNRGPQLADDANAPVNLLISFPRASSNLILRDINDRAGLDVVHAAAGVGEAEVYFTLQDDFVVCDAEPAFASRTLGDDDSGPACTAPVIPSIDYAQTVNAGFPAGRYALRVNAAGAGADNAPISADNLTLQAGLAYIAVAAGHLGEEDADLFPLLLERQTRSIATQVTLRLTHAASLAGDVGVYVTPAGDITLTDIELGEVGPTLNLAVRNNSGYLALAEGSYDVRVARPMEDGGNEILINDTLNLVNGTVLDLIARNADDNEGLFVPGVIVLTDAP